MTTAAPPTSRAIDVTDTVRAKVRDGRLSLDVNNTTMGGDPAPYQRKTLRLVVDGEAPRLLYVPENCRVRLPVNGGGIQDASYGLLPREEPGELCPAPQPAGPAAAVNLFVSYFKDSNPRRQAELDECLRRNLDNPQIDRVFILSEAPDTFDSPKITRIPCPSRPTFQTYFDAINARSGLAELGEVNILANSDIVFEERGLALVCGLDLHQRCLALARWEQWANGSITPNPGWLEGTQDAWIFRGRIRRVEDADFCLGKPNCDHSIVERLRGAGYELFNPCFDVRILHRHDSNVRHYHYDRDKTPEPGAFVWPGNTSEILRRVQWPGIIAFSLFGSDTRYTRGAVENARLAPIIYPRWLCRFSVDDSVAPAVLDELRALNADVVMMPRQKQHLSGTFWRFCVADDPRAERWIVRDADSRLSCREYDAVDQWVRSDRPFHIIRDHPDHTRPILASAFGGVRRALPSMTEMVDNWHQRGWYGDDEKFLEHIVFPLMRREALQHERFPTNWPGVKRPFPGGADFVAERFNADGTEFKPADRARLVEALRANAEALRKAAELRKAMPTPPTVAEPLSVAGNFTAADVGGTAWRFEAGSSLVRYESDGVVTCNAWPAPGQWVQTGEASIMQHEPGGSKVRISFAGDGKASLWQYEGSSRVTFVVRG